ncbi:hypothetical protein [Novosphingobium sediminicola]|uniref:Uncharacterized protein n=1 Tax=Novosphingobium sediminicola TaxID=563162 RepID=A0A7W6CJS3_9SPHN|nr:hypothetical protein [Novosphingobium sediminicola]MBB3955939.1 hypothetical protein [Novosphingobium sediminicola]
MASLITLCNEALSEIAVAQIASIDEPSIEARECKRWAPTVLEEMADWTEWSSAIKRAPLARMANDRGAEWLCAYAPPADMADPVALREAEPDAAWLPPYGPGTFPAQDAIAIPFVYEGGKIYTNIAGAILVYTTSTMDPGRIRPLVRRAFVLELAARLAFPVKKDLKLAQVKAQQAEAARNRAIADEENKNPRRAPEYISQAEWARMGVGL